MRPLIGFLLFALAGSATAADLDVVRENFVAYYTGANASASSPRVREALAGVERDGRNATAPGFFLSDGSWSDIDYKATPDGGWGPWDHSRRLMLMAKAYKTPGQPLYRDPQLLGQIDAALRYTKNFYGAAIIPTGNWWFWTIGIPLDLGPTLVLMQHDVDPALVADRANAIHLRIGNNPAARGLVGPTPVGQNLVWSAYTHLCLALVKNDATMLGLVRNAMAGVTLPAGGDGIKSDSSFHQHGAQLYTGGYGGAFAYEVAKYALIARNTQYALPPASLDSFSDYLADGVAWTLYGNYFDVSVIGREVARPSTTGWNGIAALLQASRFDSKRATEIRSAAAKMLQTWNGTLPIEMAALAAQVEVSRHPAAWPSGHRHYFASDYTVHRRPGWFASVKMFSKRTKSGENTNDENIRGSRQSDGRFYLVLSGDEYFGRDIWPAFDWTRLPGITVEQKADTASDLYGFGTRTFAGGTGDGRNGVSAMELAPLGSVMTAKKSWFFFDDAIVFLTNGITSPGVNRVETVVNQWPLKNASATVARGSDWAALENVGYWLPNGVPLHVSRDSRAGTWSGLGGSSDGTVHQKPLVTMWLDHGVAPMNAAAEYAIVPNVTVEQMRAWAASPPLQILANTAVASAVRDRRNGAMGLVFWTAGTADGIQSDSAALLYLVDDGSTLHLYAADPNAGITGTFKVTLPGAYTVSDVIATTNLRSTTLTIPRASGRTTHVALKKMGGRRRAVR